MIINKGASGKENYKLCDYYYSSAREGMYDLLSNMKNDGLIKTVFVPGYIGWSPREGSGILDPINKIDGVSVIYYRMDKKLNIDLNSLYEKIDRLDSDKFAVLIVNYFGFVDLNIEEIYARIKKKNGWIIEDNAHGFFTNIFSEHSTPDATFFSLHKMFPFSKGGSIKVTNDCLKKYSFKGETVNQIDYNPWMYDISKIAIVRKNNYEIIDKLVRLDKFAYFFEPLKDELRDGIIPQTYPIKIRVGNRDRIYELVNQSGYGVVSLYHTLIEPLRNSEHSEAFNLSKRILNLPVHQDVNSNEYESMVETLAKYCKETV